MKMKRKFEQLFCYDTAGLPRAWKQGEDVRAMYQEARRKVYTLGVFIAMLDGRVTRSYRLCPDTFLYQGLDVLLAFSTFQLDENSEVPLMYDENRYLQIFIGSESN